MTDQPLWNNITDFEIDDPQSSFNFSDRLSRENSWPMALTLRAIEEYKRFMYLVCIANHPLTPSDEVDQVWHLHLLYTESYWIEFCQNTLEKTIHHGPTKGAEQRKDFKNWYEETKKIYELEFNEIPPNDLWPTTEIRFKNIHFTRVNRHQHWVIAKPPFIR